MITTIDKKGKYLYNFIVTKKLQQKEMNKIKLKQIYTYIFSKGGIRMAQPKRRWSKARTHSKRSTWKKEQPTFATCPHCHEPVLPHRVCGNCGYYDGKQVVAKKEAENA